MHGISASKVVVFFAFHSTVYTCPVPRMGTTEGSRDKVRDGSHGVREGSRDGSHGVRESSRDRVSRDGPRRVPGIILQG